MRTIIAQRKVWLAELEHLGREMDRVEARIDAIVAALLPPEAIR